jgi:hypothetical protein
MIYGSLEYYMMLEKLLGQTVSNQRTLLPESCLTKSRLGSAQETQPGLLPVPEEKKAPEKLPKTKSNVGMAGILGPLLGPGIEGLSELELSALPPQEPGTEGAFLNTPKDLNRVKSNSSVASAGSDPVLGGAVTGPSNGALVGSSLSDPAAELSGKSRHGAKKWNHNTEKIEDLDGELALWAARNEEVVGITRWRT